MAGPPLRWPGCRLARSVRRRESLPGSASKEIQYLPGEYLRGLLLHPVCGLLYPPETCVWYLLRQAFTV